MPHPIDPCNGEPCICRLVPDPIQPKVKTDFAAHHKEACDIVPLGMDECFAPSEAWKYAVIAMLDDLNKEILELREEVEKLKNPLVTIHTPRFGTLQDATMPLKQPIDGVFLASHQLANNPKTL